jgi:hypothetical protein
MPVEKPVASAPPPGAPAVADAGGAAFDLALEEVPSGRWSGAQGNTPMSVGRIWGASGHVFVVGNGVILHSADRGLHWLATAGPAGWPGVWGSSIDDVYVGGSTVVRSTDRGQTWTPVAAVEGSVTSVWGSGPEDVYVVGKGKSPFVARTRDHGRTWTTQRPSTDADWLYAVAGRGPDDVWIAGKGSKKDPKSSIGYHTTAILVRSTDGGRSWKSVTPAKSAMTDNEEIRNLCFSGSGTLFASYSYGVFTTADHGKSWSFAVDGGGEILGLGCFGREILVGARNRNFRHSVDEGATWTSDDLDRVWRDPALFTLQAMFVADTGEVYVGGEAYNRSGGGTLVRRAP